MIHGSRGAFAGESGFWSVSPIHSSGPVGPISRRSVS
jgi:hypothetical protein